MIDEPKTESTSAGVADVLAQAPLAAGAAQLKIEHGPAIPADELARLSDEIVGALKTVYDPEIPADIYELGLIYKVDVDDERAGRTRSKGRHRLGSAVGSKPHVG